MAGVSQGLLGNFFSFGLKQSAVGLSIGSSSVKLVELKKSGKTWSLLHFGIVQLPEDSVVNREIVNQIAVVESIKTLISQIKLRS
ncbi:MAG: pilus assembly protein PilM, partial [Bdellovibrionota bacterium]